MTANEQGSQELHERCIVFGCGHDSLVGILHEPLVATSDTGILIVVGGPQYRVGSHRQFVLMARRFAAAGIATFRFDYRGMGDSSGGGRDFQAIDNDIAAAIDAFQVASPGVRRLTIFGLCDAASAALMYCPRDARITSLILANPWVRTPAGEAKAFLGHYYLRRLTQASFWRKVGDGAFQPIRALRSLASNILTATRGQPDAGQPVGPRAELDFLDRMLRSLADFRGTILIILSEQDLTAREFEDLCRRSQQWRRQTAKKGVTWCRIAASDHTFSTTGSLDRAAEAMSDWLSTNVRT